MSEINKDLLYNNKHFDLLLKLYKTASTEFESLDAIYELFTVIAVDGLKIDRASYWKLEKNNLICLNLFDSLTGKHSKNSVLKSELLPIYFKALQDGLAIVADDVLTNKYTQELKKKYLIPLGITDMLDIPIRKKGKLVGVFCCEHRDSPRSWTETDLGFARSLCDILAVKVEEFFSLELQKNIIESERKLSLITENSKDGFLVFENSKITYISPNYAKLLGYSEDEIFKLTIENIFNYIHKDDVEKVKKFVYSNLQKNIKFFKYEFRFKGKNGKYHWREDSASVIYDTKGNYNKYIIVSRDISAIKKADEKIQRLYSLSKRLNEKLLDFTHIISHNIRSNTSNMSMIIDLIDDTDDQNEKNEYFELLKISNNKLSETIFHLNETIRIRFNNETEKVKVNIKSFVENSFSSMNGILKKSDAIVTIAIPDNLELLTVPSYLDSILLNLISNSLKYNSPERKLQISVSAVYSNKKITVSFSDNGIGIDLEKNKDKLFGMYKTFHTNTDATGLGLFMTKNHVDVLGGIISVESELNNGTTFKIEL